MASQYISIFSEYIYAKSHYRMEFGMHIKDNLSKYFRIGSVVTILGLSIYIISITAKNSIPSFLSEITGSLSNNIYYSGSCMIEYSIKNQTASDFTIIRQPQSALTEYITYNRNEDSSTFHIMYGSLGNSVKEYKYDESTNNVVADASPSVVSNETNTNDTTTVNYDLLSPSNDAEQLQNNVFFEDNDEYDSAAVTADHILSESASQTLQYNLDLIQHLRDSMDTDYLIKNFYKVNSTTGIDNNMFNVNSLLSNNLAITKDASQPQILILHTHASEAFADSKPNVVSDTVVGVGDELTNLLTNKYGYNVIHHTTLYSFNTAYNSALADVQQILKDNPSIEVVLDLHRNDGTEKTTINIDGKDMAKIMFFNGVSYNINGPNKSLYNPNLATNLAFSLQMKLKAMEQYPEFTKKIFLKSYRYNMHQVGRYSLIEVGDIYNTVEEAKNAMTPLADLINQVLSGQ